MFKILIVDDDKDLSFIISEMLTDYGYGVTCAQSCDEAFFLLGERKFSLVLLDINLPDGTGFEICAQLRRASAVPVIIASARTAEDDRLTAYSSGGDDFLSKPFSPGELTAKVVSLLRRYREYRGKPDIGLSLGELEVDLASRSVKRLGVPVALTDTEYSILEYMLKNRGRTVTASELYEAVWKEKFLAGSGNTVMVHVLNLRRKIEETPSSPKIIRTVWGKGYQID